MEKRTGRSLQVLTDVSLSTTCANVFLEVAIVC